MQIKPKQLNTKTRSGPFGFTLVEILITITILAVLTAILIPNVRTITKDRNAREAARKVASLLSQASQRAITDGVAGVVLFRNPNLLIDSDLDGALEPDDDFRYGVTRMALLRKVPNYTGDFVGSLASLSATPPTLPNTAIIDVPIPIEQAALDLIAPGDRISLNNNSFDYEILNVAVNGTALELTIFLDRAPNPAAMFASSATGSLQYSVRRSPRLLRSSEIELPGDFIVDLRFSGFNHRDSVPPGESVITFGNDSGLDSTVFEPVPQRLVSGVQIDFVNRPIALLFNSDGGFESLGQLTEDTAGNLYAYTTESLGPLNLFVTEYDVDQTVAASDVNPLQSNSNLWVTMSNSSGTVNVGYNDPTGVGVSMGDLARRYNGTFTGTTIPDKRIDRGVFNAVITAARSESSLASAVQ